MLHSKFFYAASALTLAFTFTISPAWAPPTPNGGEPQKNLAKKPPRQIDLQGRIAKMKSKPAYANAAKVFKLTSAPIVSPKALPSPELALEEPQKPLAKKPARLIDPKGRLAKMQKDVGYAHVAAARNRQGQQLDTPVQDAPKNPSTVAHPPKWRPTLMEAYPNWVAEILGPPIKAKRNRPQSALPIDKPVPQSPAKKTLRERFVPLNIDIDPVPPPKKAPSSANEVLHHEVAEFRWGGYGSVAEFNAAVNNNKLKCGPGYVNLTYDIPLQAPKTRIKAPFTMNVTVGKVKVGLMRKSENKMLTEIMLETGPHVCALEALAEDKGDVIFIIEPQGCAHYHLKNLRVLLKQE